MAQRPFRRPAFQDTDVLEHDAPRVIELPPVFGRGQPPRRELSTRVGVLAALVIAGCLLVIAHVDTETSAPAMGAGLAAASQG